MAKPRIMQTMLCNSPGTLAFRCQKFRQNSNGVTPNGDAKYTWGGFKQWFSTNISLYLRNGARQGHTYYGMLIWARMFSIVWCYFQWQTDTQWQHIPC